MPLSTNDFSKKVPVAGGPATSEPPLHFDVFSGFPIQPTSVAPQPARTEAPVEELPNQLILIFPQQSLQEEFARYARRHGLQTVGLIPQLKAVLVRGENFASVWEFLRRHPEVLPAVNQPIYERTPQNRGLSGAQAFRDSGARFIGAPADRTLAGQGVTVAIIDQPVSDHPHFQGKNIQTTDLVDQTNRERMFHGNAVASIIIGPDGIAPAARLLAYGIVDENGRTDHFTLARAIVQAVDDGAQIINLSLGGPKHSPILESAVAYAHAHRVLLVAGSGNEGEERVFYPAAYPTTVAVGGISAAGHLAPFSNTGPEIDLVAPATGIHTAGAGDQLIEVSGTSFAAPFVTGAVAALLSEEPSLNAEQALELLRLYANDVSSPGFDRQSGAGAIDLERVRRRHDPGFCDIALSGLEIGLGDPAYDSLPIEITVQNQGNQPLYGAQLEILLGNRPPMLFPVGNLSPGSIRSEKVWVSPAEFSPAPQIRLEARVKLPVEFEDDRPDNNQRSARIGRPEPNEPK